MQGHVLRVETDMASGRIPRIMSLREAGNSIPQQMTSSRMTPALAKASLGPVKPAKFECPCESFWSTGINEGLRVCPRIRTHSCRMRIRNLRTSRQKANTALLVSHQATDRGKGLVWLWWSVPFPQCTCSWATTVNSIRFCSELEMFPCSQQTEFRVLMHFWYYFLDLIGLKI